MLVEKLGAGAGLLHQKQPQYPGKLKPDLPEQKPQ
jgi:hypothetical protein